MRFDTGSRRERVTCPTCARYVAITTQLTIMRHKRYTGDQCPAGGTRYVRPRP